MIITLNIRLVSGYMGKDDWSCDIEIDQNENLEDLHYVIQDAVDFDNDHLYEFYVARTLRSFDRVRFDGEYEGSLDISLSKLFPLPKNRKLFYWFDYGDSWKFQISRSRKKPREPESGKQYPVLVAEKGKKPEQYPDFGDEDY
ncbi:MAG: hypothetical protein HRT37_02325 [Alteromonadaceae bacterium]|nr:hypothetical protein [Alteromonadaceae bacterium]